MAHFSSASLDKQLAVRRLDSFTASLPEAGVADRNGSNPLPVSVVLGRSRPHPTFPDPHTVTTEIPLVAPLGAGLPCPLLSSPLLLP